MCFGENLYIFSFILKYSELFYSVIEAIENCKTFILRRRVDN